MGREREAAAARGDASRGAWETIEHLRGIDDCSHPRLMGAEFSSEAEEPRPLSERQPKMIRAGCRRRRKQLLQVPNPLLQRHPVFVARQHISTREASRQTEL